MNYNHVQIFLTATYDNGCFSSKTHSSCLSNFKYKFQTKATVISCHQFHESTRHMHLYIGKSSVSALFSHSDSSANQPRPGSLRMCVRECVYIFVRACVICACTPSIHENVLASPRRTAVRPPVHLYVRLSNQQTSQPTDRRCRCRCRHARCYMKLFCS